MVHQKHGVKWRRVRVPPPDEVARMGLKGMRLSQVPSDSGARWGRAGQLGSALSSPAGQLAPSHTPCHLNECQSLCPEAGGCRCPGCLGWLPPAPA
jgi:hypothetical protein